jgi:hypothetical protein
LEENLKQKELRERRTREKELKEQKYREALKMKKEQLMKTKGCAFSHLASDLHRFRHWNGLRLDLFPHSGMNRCHGNEVGTADPFFHVD